LSAVFIVDDCSSNLTKGKAMKKETPYFVAKKLTPNAKKVWARDAKEAKK
jgi:hypothetical protein